MVSFSPALHKTTFDTPHSSPNRPGVGTCSGRSSLCPRDPSLSKLQNKRLVFADNFVQCVCNLMRVTKWDRRAQTTQDEGETCTLVGTQRGLFHDNSTTRFPSTSICETETFTICSQIFSEKCSCGKIWNLRRCPPLLHGFSWD